MTFGFIVDQSGNGNFTTLTSAMLAAYAGVTILMRPGTYTEDVLFKDGVNVSASTGDSISGNTRIIGKCSITSGFATISNIFLQTNNDNAIEISGSSPAGFRLESCFLNSTGSNIFIDFSNTNAASSVNIHDCFGNIAGNGAYWYSTSPGHIGVESSFLGNSGLSTTQNYSIHTSIDIIASGFSSRILLNGSGNFAMGNSDMDCSGTNSIALWLTGSAGATLTNVYIASGFAQSIFIDTGTFVAAMGLNACSNSPNYVINGNGTLLYNNLSFPGTCHNVAVTTLSRMGYLG